MKTQRSSRFAVALVTACLLALVGATTAAAAAAPAKPAPAAQLIDLNKATVEQLQELPGIGPAIAQRIVEYAKNPGFKTVDDLLSVKGIGDKKLAKIRPLVTVTKAAPETKPGGK